METIWILAAFVVTVFFAFLVIFFLKYIFKVTERKTENIFREIIKEASRKQFTPLISKVKKRRVKK